jgi:acyl-CoA reductase-like NAD-dependent aldehyde dehydrogenase
MIKPSEFTPETAELLKDMMHETFGDDLVVVVTGGPEVGVAFSKLPFDHLVFTGSTSVGKHVMRAAAENLVPVTLELGGKSPAIVGESFSITAAAEKIMVGKLFNCGQTCVAPDYVLLPKGRADAFVEECKIAAAAMYPKIADNPDYTSIVNARHFDRLKSYLRDAEGKGAKVIELNAGNEELSPESRKMAPVLVLHAKEDMTVMQDEIFGPILPILTYETLDEAIAYVNDHPRPLALYYFEHSDSKVQKMLRQTISGGVTINDTILHVAQSDLPFGGVGASGIGHYHGREGFEAFTKKKPIFYQARINGSKLLRPPFGKTLDRFLRFMLGK